jgi:uncharacterized protein (DUF58 family)
MRWSRRAAEPGDGAPAAEPTARLRAVQRRLRLPARLPARGLLAGEHRSVHKGRSMELDDLRQYEHGDDVRDVDWKASARTGAVLMRRHVAERKQELLVVVDTGVEMRARAAGGGPKADLAVLVTGFVGQIAVQAGDLVGLLAGDSAGRLRAPMRHHRAHVELLLRRLEGRLQAATAPADVLGLLEDARRTTRRRSIVLVVTDEGPFTDAHVEQLRRLRVRHEVLWLTIRDAELTAATLAGADLVDITGSSRLPALLRGDRELAVTYDETTRAAATLRRQALRRLGVACDEVAADDDVIAAVVRLLDRAGRA